MSECNTCKAAILASKTVTECMCLGATEFPFYCRLHGVEKTKHFHTLCQQRPDYFQLWQEGRGPRQVTPNPDRWYRPGTWLARAIKTVTFGKIAPCTSCNSRAAQLDRDGFIKFIRRRLARK